MTFNLGVIKVRVYQFIFGIALSSALFGCFSTPEEKAFLKDKRDLYQEITSEFSYECKLESFRFFPKNIVTKTQKANDYTSDKNSDAMNSFVKSIAREYTTSKDINAADRKKHYNICIEDRLSKTDYLQRLSQIQLKHFPAKSAKNATEVTQVKTTGESAEAAFISTAKLYASDKKKEKLPQIISAFESLAGQGHARSQYYLGYFYITGIGKEQNYTLGKEWHYKSAKQGVTKAMTSLGALHTYGYGTAVDYAAARKWLNMAIKNGDPKASVLLGHHYSKGLGTAKNLSVAVKNYMKACQLGEDKGCKEMVKLTNQVTTVE